MICKLCKREREIRNSHIIPEFFYKPAYDEKHRLNLVALSDGQRKRYEQKGIREFLLCDDCENKISAYEDHVRRVFYGKTGIFIKNGNPIEISGIDYIKYKLFQLSLIWRASVSESTFFSGVDLGPHEEKIRTMILNERPGTKLDYPCLFMIFMLEGKDIIDGFIYPPQMIRVDGHRAYRFIFGGGFWIYFISKHTDKLPIIDHFVNEKGKLKIPIREITSTPFFRQLAIDIAKHNKI
jgi:hypothetical protein